MLRALLPWLRIAGLIALLVAVFLFEVRMARAAVDYDILYLRAPHRAAAGASDWPEVIDPLKIPPGTELVLRRPDGSEQVLFPPLGMPDRHKGAVLDPVLSFDARHVYFAWFPDVTPAGRNPQRSQAPYRGSDIYRLTLATGEVRRLTEQTWTPPSGGIRWSPDPLRATAPDEHYLGYGIFNMAPCPLPDGRILFVSNRHGTLPNKTFTFPNLRLYVMDADGANVEPIAPMTLGSAMHPVILRDGRVIFSSYESQGLRDERAWSLWSILPDGRYWESRFGSFKPGMALHFHTQLSDGRVAVVEYYNLNNEGFGTLLAFDAEHPHDPEAPRFGSPNGLDASNPRVRRGRWFFDPGHPEHLRPRYTQYRFSPPGLVALTAFAHGDDEAADVVPGASSRHQFAGKVTHPAAAPNNDLLLVYSPGPVNNLDRPTSMPRPRGEIRLLRGGLPVDDPNALIVIRADPAWNYMMPKAVVPYRAIYGVDRPARYDWVPNRGELHPDLPAGTPFGLVGTATFNRRDSKPGNFEWISYPLDYDGWDRFNTAENDDNPNWLNQGADAGKYGDEDVFAVRILAMEQVAHRSYGPAEGESFRAHHGRERLRVLGEIPLRKTDAAGRPILDRDGKPDTSFLARIPADTPFTLQTLDRRGMVLNMSQTWHQLRPGEMRVDCGGCHGHAQPPMRFEHSAAGQPGYRPHDLTGRTPIMKLDAAGQALFDWVSGDRRLLDVEFHRDVKPILRAKCASCHAGTHPPKGLRLDDDSIVDGFDNTWHRLANDPEARYGIPPVIEGRAWRGTNASRYVRKFQSRRSLLVWMIFGERLDGWRNADHPTERIPGDPTTLPPGADRNAADLDYADALVPSHATLLSPEEKLTIVRWIDLGAPVDTLDPRLRPYGWLNDEQPPVVTLTEPSTRPTAPLTRIRFGAFDNTSGLDRTSLSLRASFPIEGYPAGSELIGRFVERDHVWTWALPAPAAVPEGATITLRARDRRGNETVITRRLTPSAAPPIEWLDIDASSGATRYTADQDGALIVRWLLGLRGAALTEGILAPTATRSTEAIEAHLTALGPRLHVSGVGPAPSATRDGLLIVRWMMGLRGAALLAGTEVPPAEAALIEARLRALTP
jgi:hypothetical protein